MQCFVQSPNGEGTLIDKWGKTRETGAQPHQSNVDFYYAVQGWSSKYNQKKKKKNEHVRNS